MKRLCSWDHEEQFSFKYFRGFFFDVEILPDLSDDEGGGRKKPVGLVDMAESLLSLWDEREVIELASST